MAIAALPSAEGRTGGNGEHPTRTTQLSRLRSVLTAAWQTVTADAAPLRRQLRPLWAELGRRLAELVGIDGDQAVPAAVPS